MGCYVSLIILLSATISRTEMVPLLTSFPFNNHVTSSFLSSLFSSFSSSSPSPLSRYKDYKDFSVNFCEEPKDSIVLKEQSIIMNCSISISSSSSPSSLLSSSPSLNEESVKGHQVTWLRNGQRLEYNDRRLLLKNGSLCLVSGGDKKLRRPGGADNDGDDVSGRYQCRVSIEGVGVVSSRVAKLEVSLMEKTWTEEPQSSILYLGDSIILGCRLKALPPPSVKWFKDEQEIETSKSNSGFLLHADGALEIPEVKRFHFGRYKCRVRQENDKKGKTSRTISLTEEVEVGSRLDTPPRFFYRPRDVTILEGSDLVLHCGANGRDRSGARAAIQWLKDGDFVDFSDGSRRRSLKGRGSLSIARVRHEDSAHYTCRASNFDDVIESTAFVKVLVPPKFTTDLKSGTFGINTDIVLGCEVFGNPQPEVVWLKDGEPIAGEPGAIEFDDCKMVGKMCMLKIFGSLTTDAGVYQCMASSEVGSAQSSALLVIGVENKGGGDVNLEGRSVVASSTSKIVKIKRVDGRSITLSWEPGNTPGAWHSLTWREMTSRRTRFLLTNHSTATLTNLLPSRNYSIFITRMDDQSPGTPPASFLHVRTNDIDVRGPIVESLQATPLSSRSILLRWNHSGSPSVQSLSLIYQLEDLSVNMTEVRIDLPSEIRSFQVDELRPHSVYRFVLTEETIEAGDKKSAVEALCRTFSESPSSPPHDVRVEEDERNQNILLTWEKPKQANGPITGYKIKYKIRPSRTSVVTVATDAKQQRLKLSGLNSGQEMLFRVQALNVNGSGPFTPWVSTKSSHKNLDESRVPGQPTSLVVRSFGNTVFLSWMPPADQSIAVRGYVLSYGIGVPEVFKQMLDGRHRQYTVKNLKPSSEYVISLRAFNGAGEGEPVYNSIMTGELNTFVTQMPLIPPVGLKATVLSSSSILLSWMSVSDASISSYGGLGDFGTFERNRERLYTVRYNVKSSKKYKYLNTTQLNIIINDLRPDTEYEFSVRVKLRNNRVSTWSLCVFNRTKETIPSTAPRDLTPLVLDGHSSSVILNWQPPKTPNGQVTGYIVHYTTNVSNDDNNWVTEGVLGDRLTATIRGLTPETTYYFKVQARNAAGDGPLSSIVILRTPKYTGEGKGILEFPEEEEHFPHRKFFKIRQGASSTTGEAVVRDEIPQWLFWVVMTGLVVFIVLSILTLVAVVRCRRLTRGDQRRSQNTKTSSETPNATESLLLSPSTLVGSTSAASSSTPTNPHHHPIPPDICQNHIDHNSMERIESSTDRTTSTASRQSERRDTDSEQGGICGSFYYFPSKSSLSGSFKRRTNSYNPGWAYQPPPSNMKNSRLFGDDNDDGLCIHYPLHHRTSEYPYVISLEHKVNLSETFQKKLEVSEEKKLKRFSDAPSLLPAPRVDAGDMSDAKKILPFTEHITESSSVVGTKGDSIKLSTNSISLRRSQQSDSKTCHRSEDGVTLHESSIGSNLSTNDA